MENGYDVFVHLRVLVGAPKLHIRYYSKVIGHADLAKPGPC